MIRRLFWMALGAGAGVTGYRRVSRLARALQPQPRRGHRPGGRGGSSGVAVFLGDVRDGMELYMSRRGGPAGPRLEGQQVLGHGRGQAAASRIHPGPDDVKDGR